MEGSFKARVDKTFGSLASSTPPATAATISSSSLWSLTDDEIQRKEWIRDKTITEPESESFFCNSPGEGFQKANSPLELRDELKWDLEDLDDGDAGDEPQRRSSYKPDKNHDEEWNIRSTIGQDFTLDYEEERDEYDKMAIGGKKAEHRLYMRDITDYAIDVDSCNELPDSFEEVARDPRANHLAAKLRLREDAEAAKKIDSLQVSEKDIKRGEERPQINTSEGDVILKSILKRKEAQLDSMSEKRVRFEPKYEDNCNGGVSIGANFSTQCYSSAVPDYVRNPSKYTRYTLDSSSDMDDTSNKQAYMDFLKLIKRSNDFKSQPDAFSDLPAVTFIPKRKIADTKLAKKPAALRQNEEDNVDNKFMQRRELHTGIAAGEMEAAEVCAMEEDDMELVADGRNSLQRLGRKYRTKSGLELDESVV